MAKNLQIILALVILTSPHWADAVDLESAKEGACWDVNTTSMDVEWALSIKPWYYPIMCRSDLYQTSAVVLKKSPEEIQENEIYYKGCMTWEMDKTSAAMIGFGGHRSEFMVKQSEGMEKIEFINKEEGDLLATCYTTMTDNKTFYVNACCLKGDQMIWGVNSPMKTLPEETVKAIHDHVEELGFSRKQFTGLNYDLC